MEGTYRRGAYAVRATPTLFGWVPSCGKSFGRHAARVCVGPKEREHGVTSRAISRTVTIPGTSDDCRKTRGWRQLVGPSIICNSSL